jgi:hypothetical protein
VTQKSQFYVRADSIFLRLGPKNNQQLKINAGNIQKLINILTGTTSRREVVQVRQAHQRNLISTLRGGASSTAQEEEYENGIEFENLYQLYEDQSQTIEDQQNDIDDLEDYIEDIIHRN